MSGGDRGMFAVSKGYNQEKNPTSCQFGLDIQALKVFHRPH